MKTPPGLELLLSGALLAGAMAGCSKQRPASAEWEKDLRAAFKDSSKGAKEAADAAASASEQQERGRALLLLNALSTAPDVTPEQRAAASHAAATMRQELAKAAAQGDKEAAALMQAYRSSK